jgi:hypothetical protein
MHCQTTIQDKCKKDAVSSPFNKISNVLLAAGCMYCVAYVAYVPHYFLAWYELEKGSG